MNIHENTYWCSGTNYEPVQHVPTGSGIVPCLLGRAKLQMASEQGSLWHIESSLKYNIISYKIIHELVLCIMFKKPLKMLLIKMHGLYK